MKPFRAMMLRQAAGGGGGGGQPPDTYANLTFWYDGDNSAHYEGVQSTDPAPLDGEYVHRTDSVAAIARVHSRDTSHFYERKIPVVGSSNGIEVIYNTAPGNGFFTKPAAGASPSTAQKFSNMFAAANAVIVVAIRVDAAETEVSPGWWASSIISDEAYFCGLGCYKSGSTIHFQAINYDGNYDVASVSESVGTWVVITMRHAGGQLQIRKNGGAWTSVASGNTQAAVTSQVMRAFHRLTGRIAQYCTYNANRADAELLEVERYFGAKVGITI